MENFIDRTLKPLALVTLSMMVLLVGLVTFWLVYPYNVTDYKGEFKTDFTEYTQGDMTFYTVKYCKYMDIKPEVTKHFVDGLIFNAEETSANLTLGCKTQGVPLHIPMTLPPGRYQLKVELKYKVNPIRTITITNKSNWFTVVENPLNDIEKIKE